MGRARRTSLGGVPADQLRSRTLSFSSKSADRQFEEMIEESDGYITTTALKEMQNTYQQEGRFQEASRLEVEIGALGVRIVRPEDLP